MARTTTNKPATSIDEEKINEVAIEPKETVAEEPVAEPKETVVEEPKVEKAAEEKPVETKVKQFKDDANVKICCVSLAGKTVIGTDLNKVISFDDKGIAEVSGKEANRFLTIPGYTLAK